MSDGYLADRVLRLERNARELSTTVSAVAEQVRDVQEDLPGDLPGWGDLLEQIQNSIVPGILDDIDIIKTITIPNINLDLAGILEDVNVLKDVSFPSLSDLISRIEDTISRLQNETLVALQGAMFSMGGSLLGSLELAAQGVLEARTLLDGVESIVRDAGIVVDPATGTVRIYALEAERRERELLFSTVQQTLDAHSATLETKASRSYVNEVAAALLSDGIAPQDLLLADIRMDITRAEQRISGAEAAIENATDMLRVDGQIVTMGLAVSRLDAIEGEISDMVTYAEISEDLGKIRSASQRLDAMEGVIGSEVVAAEARGDDIGEALLTALMNQELDWEALRGRSDIALAMAKDHLSAQILDGFAAEATHRMALASLLDGQLSMIQEEQKTLADQYEATTESLSTLVAQVEQLDPAGEILQLTGAITEEALARATADSAMTQYSRTQVATTADLADLSGEGVLEALILGDAQGEAFRGSLALAREEISTKIVEGLSAEARRREELAAVVDDNAGYVQNLAETVATQNEVTATSLAFLSARMGENTSAINEETSARVAADEAMTQYSRTQMSTTADLADLSGEGVLSSLILGDAQGEAFRGALALAREEVSTQMVEGISAEARRREELAAVVNDNAGYVRELSEAVANQNEASAATTAMLLARVEGVSAVISEEMRVRAAEDSTLTQYARTQISTSADLGDITGEGVLEALVLGDAQRESFQNSLALAREEISTNIVEGISAEARRREELAAVVDDNAGYVQNLAETVATQNQATARSIDALYSRTGEQSASIVQTMQTISEVGALLRAQYTLQTEVIREDGTRSVAGFGLVNDGSTGSEFMVRCDRFAVIQPTGAGAVRYPLMVGNVNGAPSVGIDGTLLVDGTIYARSLVAGSVTVDKLAAGAVTADKISAGAITAAKIASGAITAGMITSGTLNAAQVSVINLNASNINAGTINADTINVKNLNTGSLKPNAVTKTVTASFAEKYIDGTNTLEYLGSASVYLPSEGSVFFLVSAAAENANNTWGWGVDVYTTGKHFQQVNHDDANTVENTIVVSGSCVLAEGTHYFSVYGHVHGGYNRKIKGGNILLLATLR